MWASYLIMAYIIFAASWWAILLFKKNREAYDAQMELHQIKRTMTLQGNAVDKDMEDAGYELLQKRFTRQKEMIQGETLFFLISIIAGTLLIYNAGVSRIGLANRQRNFILAVSHELKSPLTTIQMVLETFKNKQLTPQQSQMLVTSGLSETGRLRHLVDNLLLIARQEYVNEPATVKTEIGKTVRDIVSKYRLQYPDFRIALSGDIQPVVIGMNVQDLIHVINNLIDNAVKYSSEEKDINIAIKSSETEVVLEIADKGIGIPDGEKAKIYKIFYRVGLEDTRTTQGTGLGLYIADVLMRKAGGRISVQDNVPSGTIFTLHFKH